MSPEDLEAEIYWKADPRYHNRPFLNTEEEPYFERVILKSGKIQWRLSPPLYWRAHDLECKLAITDQAAIAGMQALSMVETSFGLEIEGLGVVAPRRQLNAADAMVVLENLVLPFARLLSEPTPSDPKEEERNEKAAMAWLQQVLNIRNRSIPKDRKFEHQALSIIRAAEELCYLLDRVPNKAEIKEHLTNPRGDAFGFVENPEEFKFESDTWRKRFHLAGLSNLRQHHGY